MSSQTPLFDLPPVVEKTEPVPTPTPKKQWFIVYTDINGNEWAYWRSHDNGIIESCAIELLSKGYKPKRYKTINGAKRALSDWRDSRGVRDGTYSVREWVENA